MIKVVCLFKRRKDLTPEQFKKHYEENHARIVGQHVNIPAVARYVRRYLTPTRNPVSGETVETGYDVIMEMWIRDRATFEAMYITPVDPARDYRRRRAFLRPLQDFGLYGRGARQRFGLRG